MKHLTCKALIILSFGATLQADWELAGNALTASDSQNFDFFGFSVDVGKNYAVVGAPYVSGGLGAVYIFQRENGGAWQEMQKISALNAIVNPSGQFNATDTVTLKSFGFDVALGEAAGSNPDMIVVGAPSTSVEHNSQDVTTGAFCTYELNPNTNLWEQQSSCGLGVVMGVDGSYQSGFGHSVEVSSWVEDSISNAKMVIGDPYFDQKYSNVGMAAFYDYNGSSWNVVDVTAGHGGAAASTDVNFGKSVAIYHNDVIIGAPGYNIYDPNDDDPNAVMIIEDVGAVHYYSAQGDFMQTYTPPHEERVGGHHFGSSVDIFGNFSVVSEAHREGGTTYAALYVMQKNSDTDHTLHNYIENNGVGYGHSVAINDTHLAVTTYNVSATGSVYMYKKDAQNDYNTTEPFRWIDIVKRSSFGFDVALYKNDMLIGSPLSENVKQFQYAQESQLNPALLMYLLN